MAKNILKVNSLEELNGFLNGGKVIYSIANAGNIWFIEYNDSDINTPNETKADDLESIIEKGKRLGYFDNEERIFQVRAFLSLFSNSTDDIKNQAVEYVYARRALGTSPSLRSEIRDFLNI